MANYRKGKSWKQKVKNNNYDTYATYTYKTTENLNK
jgi:hypothetical protein